MPVICGAASELLHPNSLNHARFARGRGDLDCRGHRSPLMSCPWNIVEVTRRCERWLAQRMRLINSDLKLKHQRMAENPSTERMCEATFSDWRQRRKALR
jgi:hypothetical protein